MAAPSFVNASAGITDASGSWSLTGYAPASLDNFLVFQVFQDGATSDAIGLQGGGGSFVRSLAGADHTVTHLGSFPVGNPTAGWQHIYVGRPMALTGVGIAGTNSTSEDVYVRVYEFSGVNTGTTLADVIENVTAGATVNEVGSSDTCQDARVETLGPDRLALNFIAVNDDNTIGQLSPGSWTVPVSQYAESSGTDGALMLQTKEMASAGVVDGGTASITAIDSWGVVGFALIPAGPATPTGTITQTLPALAQSAQGAARVDGDAAGVLPALTQDAAGAAVVEGDATGALPAFAQDAAGVLTVEGADDTVLPGLAQAASGALRVAGAGNTTLPALTQEVDGAVAGTGVTGNAAQTLPALTQDSAGALEVNGFASTVLPALGQGIAGGLKTEGAAGQTLPALSQAADGLVGVDGVAGPIANVLPALGQDAEAGARVAGPADAALPGLGQSAGGTLTVTGDAAGVLGALAAAAGGALRVAGDGASVLPALSQNAAGSVTTDAAGAVVQTLPALSQVVAARVFEAGLPTIRELLAGVLYVPTRVGAQLGNPKGNEQWRRLRRGQDVVVTRAQLSMFGAHPDKPDVGTSELWLLSGDSTLTPTE